MTDPETNPRMTVPVTHHLTTDLETNILLTITTVMTTNRIVVVTDVMEETDATGEMEEMDVMEKMDETERTDVMARMPVAKDTKKFEDLLDHEGTMGIPDVPVLLVLRAFKVKRETKGIPEKWVQLVLKETRGTRGIPEKWVQLVLREFRVKPVLLEAQDQPDTFPKHSLMLIPLHHKTFPLNNPLSMIR
jgi:hypothetical protein